MRRVGLGGFDYVGPKTTNTEVQVEKTQEVVEQVEQKDVFASIDFKITPSVSADKKNDEKKPDGSKKISR